MLEPMRCTPQGQPPSAAQVCRHSRVLHTPASWGVVSQTQLVAHHERGDGCTNDEHYNAQVVQLLLQDEDKDISAAQRCEA